MNVNIKFEGVSEFDAAVSALVVKMEAVVTEAKSSVADVVKSTVRPTVEKSRNLGDSIVARMDEPGMITFGPTMPYTRVIEMGHKGNQNKPPHPWFIPGVREHSSELVAPFVEGWRRVLGGERG